MRTKTRSAWYRVLNFPILIAQVWDPVVDVSVPSDACGSVMLVDTNESFVGRTLGKVSFVILLITRISACVSLEFKVAVFKAFNISSG